MSVPSSAGLPTVNSVTAVAVASELDQKKAKENSALKLQPINETIYNIGVEVRAGHFLDAGKLLKDNTLKIGSSNIKRVWELIYLPFHMSVCHDFQKLCYYKSICLQALAGDPKAQEIRDSWHTINTIEQILHNDQLKCNGTLGVNRDPAIPIFYAYESDYFSVSTQKRETLFSEEIIFTLKQHRSCASSSDSFVKKFDELDLIFTTKSDTKFLFFANLYIGPRVIQGRIVDDELEITIHRFDNHPEENPNNPNNADDRERNVEQQIPEVLTLDRINPYPTDFPQKRIDEIMDFVRKRFRAYQNPHSGVSILMSDDKLFNLPSMNLASYSERHSSYRLISWTAKDEPEHTIGNSYLSNLFFSQSPFDKNKLTYKFNDEETSCTVCPEISVNGEQQKDSSEYQMVFKKTEWDTAAGLFLETMQRPPALPTSYYLSNCSFYTLFEHDRSLFLELPEGDGRNWHLYVQTAGVWHTKLTKRVGNKIASYFETQHDDGYCLRRSHDVVKKYLAKNSDGFYLKGYEDRISSSIQTPSSAASFLPLTVLPFNINSEEDQERYGVRIETPQGKVEFRASSFSDVLAADFLRRNFKLIHPHMVNDLIKLICQFVSFIPNQTQTK